MCLSTAYAVDNGTEEKICEYVCKLKINGDVITLTDMMECDTDVKGRLVSCDFVHSKIVIERL